MRKKYSAVYTLQPHSTFTKLGFGTIKAAEAYIKEKSQENRELFHRSLWLVVENNALGRILTMLEKDYYGKEESVS